MKEWQAVFMIENYKHEIESEKQKYEKIKGQKCGKIRFLVSYYNKEFTYGIILAIVTALTMLNSYLQLQLILMIKDDNDDAEVNTAKILSVLMFFLLFSCQYVLAVFNLNKYRKTNYLIGHGSIGLLWLGMGISYYFGSFLFAKISAPLFSVALGLSV